MGKAWDRLRGWTAKRRVELRLSFRLTASAVLCLAISHLLNLAFPLWAVLTAVVLTQVSVGQSLRTTFDYLASTVGGALYAGMIGMLIPHDNEIALLAALAVAVAPVAMIAAANPRFRVAPVTAVMVFMGPTITHAGPIASAFERMTEVTVGAVVGLIVSFLVLPARAHELTVETAARLLTLMAQALPQLFAGFTRGLDVATLRTVQDSIGATLARLNAVAAEAKHEQIARVAPLPDASALLRTLLRLRHDLVMIGRAAMVPLPERLQDRLGKSLEHLCAAGVTYLRASATELVNHRGPAALDQVEAAFSTYAAEMSALRAQSLTRDLETEVVERLFALGFALEQLHQNFLDLARCVMEFSQSDTGL
jgi:uncharacterized membrane protein YccC